MCTSLAAKASLNAPAVTATVLLSPTTVAVAFPVIPWIAKLPVVVPARDTAEKT